MKIRFAEPADALAIINFNQQMARETENKILPLETITAGVEAVFGDANKGFYVVAETDLTEIAACLLVTFEWSDWRAKWFWWIQSVYVRQDFRGHGVYAQMYDWVKQKAQEKGDVCGFRLYVERENTTAQRVYERLGMSETVYKMYEA